MRATKLIFITILTQGVIDYVICTKPKTFKSAAVSNQDFASTNLADKNKIKIAKCCENNKRTTTLKRCRDMPGAYKHLNISRETILFDRNLYKTGKMLGDVFEITPGEFSIKSFRSSVEYKKHDYYLTEDGDLYMDMPNKWNRWIKMHPGEFCVDYYSPNATTTPVVRFFTPSLIGKMPPTSISPDRANFLTGGFVVSCVLFALVLAVYWVLSELRNLTGLMLMAYIGSLLMAFVLQAVLRSVSMVDTGCAVASLFVYFFWLASFCWTNVMSLDIWWTFRGFAKARPIHRRGERFKFLMYCLYAWGLPLAMALALAALTYADLSPVPWLVSPNLLDSRDCFLADEPKVLYLYTPMLILSMSNWVFFLLTVSNIRSLQSGTKEVRQDAAGNRAAHRRHQKRLLVYLRLSIVMGINWVLEVVSYYRPADLLSMCGDAYNVLLGVPIFLIFVCKRKVLAKLIKRYRECPISRRRTQYQSQNSHSSETDMINETPRVCMHPNGCGRKQCKQHFDFP